MRVLDKLAARPSLRPMKRALPLLYVVLGLLLASCGPAPSSPAAEVPEQIAATQTGFEALQQKLRYNPSWQPTLSAHRGGGGTGYPENCIATLEHSLQLAQAAGLALVFLEVDVRECGDATLVLLHDEELDRTSNGSGPVSDYTLDELRALRLKDEAGTLTEHTIPTLAEVLQWAKGKPVVLTLDVKRGLDPQRVIDTIEAERAEGYVAYITYNLNQAREVMGLKDELMISASLRSVEDIDRWAASGLGFERIVAFVGTREPDAEVYQQLHARGVLCMLGTLGNLDRQAASRGDARYQQWLTAGADVLATDRVAAVANVLKQARAEPSA